MKNFINEIRTELHHLDVGTKALRSFGRVVGLVLLGIATFILWRRGWTLDGLTYTLGGIGLALIVLGMLLPTVLRPLYRVWMGLALVLGFIMTRVLLTLVFYLAVFPTGIGLRIFGKDPMHRKIDRDAPSYWIKKMYRDDSPKRLERYF